MATPPTTVVRDANLHTEDVARLLALCKALLRKPPLPQLLSLTRPHLRILTSRVVVRLGQRVRLVVGVDLKTGAINAQLDSVARLKGGVEHHRIIAEIPIASMDMVLVTPTTHRQAHQP